MQNIRNELEIIDFKESLHLKLSEVFIEEVYEKYVRPLSIAERLRLLENDSSRSGNRPTES